MSICLTLNYGNKSWEIFLQRDLHENWFSWKCLCFKEQWCARNVNACGCYWDIVKVGSKALGILCDVTRFFKVEFWIITFFAVENDFMENFIFMEFLRNLYYGWRKIKIIIIISINLHIYKTLNKNDPPSLYGLLLFWLKDRMTHQKTVRAYE